MTEEPDAQAAGESEEAVPGDVLGRASVDHAEAQDPLLDLRGAPGTGRRMMEHSIKDERANPDEVWPMVPDREIAKFLLSRLVDDHQTAQNVWNAVVQPLYDLREASARWPRGRCSCGAVHPTWYGQYPGLRSERTRGHRMWCRWYTGPLKHLDHKERDGFASGEPMIECTCGKRYYKFADSDETKRNVCPDFMLIWRGERPKTSEEVIMSTEKDEKDSGGKDDKPILEPPPEKKR